MDSSDAKVSKKNGGHLEDIVQTEIVHILYFRNVDWFILLWTNSEVDCENR